MSLEVRIQTINLTFDVLLELDLTERPSYNCEKLLAYDSFLCGWCLEHPRYKTLGTRPVACSYVATSVPYSGAPRRRTRRSRAESSASLVTARDNAVEIAQTLERAEECRLITGPVTAAREGGGSLTVIEEPTADLEHAAPRHAAGDVRKHHLGRDDHLDDG